MKNSRDNYGRINNICLIILAGVAVTVALIYTRAILVPFVISFFIYAVVAPAISWLHVKCRFPRILAILTTVIVFILAFTVLIVFISSSLIDFFKDAQLYRSRILEFLAGAQQFINENDLISTQIDTLSLENALKSLPLFSVAKNITNALISFFANTVLIMIFVLFMLVGEGVSYKATSGFVGEIRNNISRYIGIKFITSVATGIIAFIVLASFGVELAFLFGIITILLNFIPTIGSIIATFLPVPIILLQFGPGWQLGVIFPLLMATQFSIGNIVEPKLMGRSMGLHPIAILLFLMFWGLVWGIPGMFLAVPITSIVKIVLGRIDTTAPLADLLEGRV
ncbi:MAG: AI-2E family transporter [Spirochaetes bacterium]|nr:AI-2E family transporter [Spirochaetota bacterium]